MVLMNLLHGTKNMRILFHKISYLLLDSKKQIRNLLIIFIFGSLFEVLSLALIGPYVALISGQPITEGALSSLMESLGIKDSINLIFYFSFIIISVYTFKALLGILINRSIIKFTANHQIKLRNFLMQSYQSLPYETFMQRNSSEYIFNMQALVPQFTQKILLNGIMATSAIFSSFCILCFLAWYNLPMFLVLVSVIALTIWMYDQFFRKRMVFFGKKSNKAGQKMTKSIQEGVEGLKEIRILKAEQHFFRNFANQSENYAFNYSASTIIQTSARFVMELLMIVFFTSVVILASLGNMQSSLFSTLAVFGVASLKLIPSMNILSITMNNLRFSEDGVDRLYKDFSALKGLTFSATKELTLPQENFESISLKGVCYKYPKTDEDVLKNINIDIKSGDCVGVIGHSGSGKTTLVDLLLGLLEPHTGKIYFNDQELKDSLQQLRENVVYLPQEVFMFDDTLLRNIAVGQDIEDIDENSVIKALKDSRLYEFTESLPEKLNTLIGERGVKLSGGQKQRVALARAFYLSRSVIILDESTSALDTNTEQEINSQISNLRGKLTQIIIAHRHSTLSHCDFIIKLENGEIVSRGTPAEILNLD